MLLVLFWPRPFAIAAGDGMRYYSGARHVADEGRYYEDYASRPAQPITMHPPLQSLLWAGLLKLGLSPGNSLLIIHAVFLVMLGAAGGALAYRITRSWHGPVTWLILSCAWPGGVNWILWVRPLTEAGTAALFVTVAWALCVALDSDKPRRWLWFAATLAGLATVLKVTGAFCFPVVGIVTLSLWRRHKETTGLYTTLFAMILMALPYTLWALRNLALTGAIETNKPSHELASTFALMATTSRAMAEWFLPIQLAVPAAQVIHPLLIVLPVIVATIFLCAWCSKTRHCTALIPCSMVAIAFMALGVAMTTKLTEESRYWSVMIPCLTLGLLAVRPPQGQRSRPLFLMLAVGYLMFSCARFAGTYRSLWYATPLGFYVQQTVLATALVVGTYLLHRITRQLWTNARCKSAHLAAIVICAIVALGFWRLGNVPKPMMAYAPLMAIGISISLTTRRPRSSAVLCASLSLLPITATWYLGQWSRCDVVLPIQEYYERDGVLVKLTAAEKRARSFVQQRILPQRFASNFPERFSDMFGEHAQVPLCPFPDETRFRAGVAQVPHKEQRILAQWIRHLRTAHLGEPFVIIYLPDYAVRGRFYGPDTLEELPEIELQWKLRQDDLHIAICTLIDKPPSIPSSYEARVTHSRLPEHPH